MREYLVQMSQIASEVPAAVPFFSAAQNRINSYQDIPFEEALRQTSRSRQPDASVVPLFQSYLQSMARVIIELRKFPSQKRELNERMKQIISEFHEKLFV